MVGSLIGRESRTIVVVGEITSQPPTSLSIRFRRRRHRLYSVAIDRPFIQTSQKENELAQCALLSCDLRAL